MDWRDRIVSTARPRVPYPLGAALDPHPSLANANAHRLPRLDGDARADGSGVADCRCCMLDLGLWNCGPPGAGPGAPPPGHAHIPLPQSDGAPRSPSQPAGSVRLSDTLASQICRAHPCARIGRTHIQTVRKIHHLRTDRIADGEIHMVRPALRVVAPRGENR